ncbi:MAG: ABC transporter ATP-binding protein [Roseiflexaceae bacterium]|nr:ABC transporter ATP-binding protein [Roseiflexus sp.]MDW8212860.1 ABC transporter ATP-binding protein [Roseiflexaceae bacterium]
MLVVDSIEVFYGEFQALFGVSLEVAEGETVAIIGANGAGKTTLLRTIAGVLRPRSGQVQYRGMRIDGRPAYAVTRLGIAMVPEGRKIFPSLSVRENLLIGRQSGRKGPWTLERVFDLFPVLRERADFPGIDLSGGQQQMLAIGRALMSNPDLILMDEISLGLAPVVVRELYETVQAITRTGTTVVIVEQDVTRSLQVADRVYCLLEGEVSLSGRPTDLSREQISLAYFGV